jgi:hypothetical protein
MSRAGHGAALPGALVLVALAGIVSAAVATLARTELALVRHRDAAAHALAAADACLAAVAADLPVGWAFDAVVAGPDGISGTADDGARAAPADCSAWLMPAPGAPLPPRALLAVDAAGGGGRRRLEAVVARAVVPAVPALLWIADPASLATVDGRLELAGADAARPAALPLAPIAAPGDPAVLDAWLAAQAGRVDVAPAGTVPLRAAAPPLGELAARLRVAGAAAGGTLVVAGVPPLALTLVPGDLIAPPVARGRGLLFVDGRLDIGGTFEFSGVIVASGGIRVASGARLDVAGAVWLGAGAALLVDGEARVAARADDIESADGLLPLPRRAVLAGLHDLP